MDGHGHFQLRNYDIAKHDRAYLSTVEQEDKNIGGGGGGGKPNQFVY